MSKPKNKRVHKEIYGKNYVPKEVEVLCKECFGMPWRREQPRCILCGEEFRDEHVTQNFELLNTSINMFDTEE